MLVKFKIIKEFYEECRRKQRREQKTLWKISQLHYKVSGESSDIPPDESYVHELIESIQVLNVSGKIKLSATYFLIFWWL